MSKRIVLIAVTASVVAGIAYAQYPIMNMIADKVIQKYQSSTCEQLWESRGKQNPEEQRVMSFLKQDQMMREAFFNKIAGPVMNKMFECGMIP
ncbi:MAG: hypothetical protein IT522_04735 [Burkholderiales bacterium]|nr:hypothetical protein [Burkholderiales bacterium]